MTSKHDSGELESYLVPHDGTELAAKAVDALLPFVGSNARVTILFVDDGTHAATKAVEGACAELRARGAMVTVRAESADSATRAILEVGSAEKPDLVAMATHGRSGFDRLVHGSVEETVARSWPGPVLVVNPATEPAAKISSVLVPIDDSEGSKAILQTVIPLASSHRARVTLLHVALSDPTDSESRAHERQQEHQAQCEQWLGPLIDLLEGNGLAADFLLRHGDVGEEILRSAKSDDHDMLAMTTHGRAGPHRWLLGSTAEEVARKSTIPVLLARWPGS